MQKSRVSLQGTVQKVNVVVIGLSTQHDKKGQGIRSCILGLSYSASKKATFLPTFDSFLKCNMHVLAIHILYSSK